MTPYSNVHDVTERLTQLRARGDEASLEEASRIEREHEKAQGGGKRSRRKAAPSDPDVPVRDVAQPQLPSEPPPVTPPPDASERRGFASKAAEQAADDEGFSLDELTGTGKDGAVTVADVKQAAEAS